MSYGATLRSSILCTLLVLASCDEGPTAPTTEPDAPIPQPSPVALEACVTTSPDPAVVPVGEAVTLNASCSQGGAAPVQYEWNLGDGRSRGGMVIHPRYQEAGTYRVRLDVTDAAGRRESAEADVRIVAPLQACLEWTQASQFETDLAPCGFHFDASCSTGEIVEYQWFFQGNPLWPDFHDVTMTTRGPNVSYTWRDDIACIGFRPFERIVRVTVLGADGETATVEEVVPVALPF